MSSEVLFFDDTNRLIDSQQALRDRVLTVIWKEKASSNTRAPQAVKAPGRGRSVAISPMAWHTNTNHVPITTYAMTMYVSQRATKK